MSNNKSSLDDVKGQALALLHRHMLPEAARLIENACRASSDDTEAWEILASIYYQLGDLNTLVNVFRQLVRLQPGSAQAHFNLALALDKTGSRDEAIASYHNVLRLDNDNADAQYNIGLALQEQGQPADAVPYYRDALRIRPHWPEAFHNLALALRQQGNLGAAIEVLEEAVEVIPLRMNLHYALGETYDEDCQFEKSILAYRKALKIEPYNSTTYTRIGDVLLHQGKPDVALKNYQNALNLSPDDLDAQAGLIEVYDATGKYDQACSILLPLLENNPDSVNIALKFANLCNYLDKCDEAVELLEGLLKHETISQVFARKIHFALGKLYDHAGKYDQAFTHFSQANKMKHYKYDIQRFAAITDALVTSYSCDRLSKMPRASRKGNQIRLVFIVGMPRSGTSLVEQIIACHSQVFGAGELDIIPRFVANLDSELGSHLPYPHCIQLLTEERLDSLANRYIKKVEQLYSGEPRIVTDKMPENFIHLGLIELLFPQARIIHCIRDPLDTCLSNYFHDFSGTHHYAYDLKSLGAYYYQYKQLMGHWNQVLKLPILQVGYEDLVTDTEAACHRIFDFINLDWEEQCLLFYNSGRFVTTSSQKQVNKPIYDFSISRWKNYQAYLGPLNMALEQGR